MKYAYIILGMLAWNGMINFYQPVNPVLPTLSQYIDENERTEYNKFLDQFGG